ncbi:MAG: alkaline phosphatase family protein [Candidatus Delongbacteria bacterium]|nr:alkaline phosphatase family protein [Candidatus Delongbacteria bacterium]
MMNTIRRHMRWIALGMIILGLGCARSQAPKSGISHSSVESLKPYVLLISIDAYRYDYTDRFNPPNLRRFRDEGSWAQAMQSVYPSKTFPNHYSIITGLYPSHHGIVDNKFYDRKRREVYSIGNREMVEDGSWYGGFPIWVVCERNRITTASFFWVGSEADIQGIMPTYYYNYDSKITYDQRVDQVVQWFRLPESQRPRFVTLYFAEVDAIGHKYGTDSPELAATIAELDQSLGRLFRELEQIDLPINIIVVSDHGMQDVDLEDITYIDDYINTDSCQVFTGSTQAGIYLRPYQSPDSVLNLLNTNRRHFKAYRQDKAPRHWHLDESPRLPDIIVDMESPYIIAERRKEKSSNSDYSKAMHGYDPEYCQAMDGIFYAQGPHIKSGKILPKFQNIHVYPFILKLMGLESPMPVDGSEKVLKPLLLPGAQTKQADASDAPACNNPACGSKICK